MPIIGYRNKFITGEIGDTGAASSSPPGEFRIMQSDGSFKIQNDGIGRKTLSDYYIDILRTPLWKVICGFFAIIFFTALIFTFIFLLIGNTSIIGLPATGFGHKMLRTFLFSLQSMTTSGFGLSSVSYTITIVAGIEALTGLFIFALATSVLYGRFSMPTAKLRHSDRALISPYKSGWGLMFRVCNDRRNTMVNVEWTIMIAFNQLVGERPMRRYHRLKPDTPGAPFFPLTWTVVHEIDESSPIWNLTEQDFKDGSAELLVIINGFDETFNQSVHGRFSYSYHEIVWHARFCPTHVHNEDGTTTHHMNEINKFEWVK